MGNVGAVLCHQAAPWRRRTSGNSRAADGQRGIGGLGGRWDPAVVDVTSPADGGAGFRKRAGGCLYTKRVQPQDSQWWWWNRSRHTIWRWGRIRGLREERNGDTPERRYSAR